MGLERYFGAKVATTEWVPDLRQLFDELGFCEPNCKEGCYAK
ncbi:UNVERIFIED_ORG: hypothetical protein J2Y94_002038 [Pseudomonas poae]